MNSNAQPQRQESDRLKPKRWYSAFFARPEVGPLGVMLLLFAMLGYFSIPQGEFSLNPFAGEGFNALGIRNNFRVISQLGIVALGAGMLIIAGEFDLSVGSMIGFAGGAMAMILKWGFAVVIPYVSFEGGFHFEGIKLFEITNVSPLTALLITLVMTLSFGWFQGFIIVKSGIASFIVTLGGLFFLRGLTEVTYRAFNKKPDQTAGSTTVTDLPDIKNIINVPGHGEMERDAAKALSNEELLEILNTKLDSNFRWCLTATPFNYGPFNLMGILNFLLSLEDKIKYQIDFMETNKALISHTSYEVIDKTGHVMGGDFVFIPQSN